MKNYEGLEIAIYYFQQADVIRTSSVNVNVQWILDEQEREVFTND